MGRASLFIELCSYHRIYHSRGPGDIAGIDLTGAWFGSVNGGCLLGDKYLCGQHIGAAIDGLWARLISFSCFFIFGVLGLGFGAGWDVAIRAFNNDCKDCI